MKGEWKVKKIWLIVSAIVFFVFLFVSFGAAKTFPKPEEVQAIYLGSPNIFNERKIAELERIIKTTVANGIVIDFKDSNSLSQEHMANLVKRFKKHNTYTIARIVAFQDSYFARKHPELAIKTSSGEFWWSGRKEWKRYWLDPASEKVWDYNIEVAKRAIDAGFDAVIFDGTELPFEENIKVTKQCVDYARNVNPEILVEGELGFIGKSSKILEGIPAGVKISKEFLTKPDEAKKFVLETGIDLLAPAVGNIHGMLKEGKDPALDLERIAEIAVAVKIPLVLHGGSGNSAEDFSTAIKHGVSIIHINTEIRLAYHKALVLSLQDNPEEIAPYKYLKEPRLAMGKVVDEKLRVFNGSL